MGGVGQLHALTSLSPLRLRDLAQWGDQDVAEFFRLDDTVQRVDALYNVLVISHGDLVRPLESIWAVGVTGAVSLHR